MSPFISFCYRNNCHFFLSLFQIHVFTVYCTNRLGYCCNLGSPMEGTRLCVNAVTLGVSLESLDYLYYLRKGQWETGRQNLHAPPRTYGYKRSPGCICLVRFCAEEPRGRSRPFLQVGTVLWQEGHKISFPPLGNRGYNSNQDVPLLSLTRHCVDVVTLGVPI